MPKKKLYNGPVIEVDPQIILWRKKRKHLGCLKRSGGDGKRGPKPRVSEAEKMLADTMKILRG